MPGQYPAQRTSIRFYSPADMRVAWFVPYADGRPGMEINEIKVPGRYNFSQAAIYRLRLSSIPNRPLVTLYPTLEVMPANLKTCTFLAHSSVPVAFTDEDFEQVAAGNYVVKVIYLPDPRFQDIITAGPNELVSTRLEPGADPIAEACRRGHILAIVRLGNIDLELQNSPPMDAPPFGGKGVPPPSSTPTGPAPGKGASRPIQETVTPSQSTTSASMPALPAASAPTAPQPIILNGANGMPGEPATAPDAAAAPAPTTPPATAPAVAAPAATEPTATAPGSPSARAETAPSIQQVQNTQMPTETKKAGPKRWWLFGSKSE
jgi:hypothetical protein